MTPIPPLDRTSPTFRADVDTYFSTRIPTLTVELNALADDLTIKQGLASGAAISTNNDKIATAADRVQTGLDRVQTGQDRAAAAASAATIGVTAAFSDANPIVKNAADNTKLGGFDASLITTGTRRNYQLPNRNGTMALTDDTAMVLLASVVPVDNALTVDFLNVFSSTYDNYSVIIRTMEGSVFAGENIRLRLAVAGVVDANSRYNSTLTSPLNTTPESSNLGTSGYGFGYLQNSSMSGTIDFFNVNGTNTSKGWRSESQSNSNGGANVFTQSSYGFYIGASAISGFRLFVSGSAAKFLAKGSIEVYGYKKAA